MIMNIVTKLPVQAQTRVLMALIANCNARLVVAGRQELALANRDHPLFAKNDGPRSGANTVRVLDQTTGEYIEIEHGIDKANTAAEQARARHEGNRVASEQGHTVEEPLKAAELLASFREDLMAQYLQLCETYQIRPLDQTFAAYIDWQVQSKFVANAAEAEAIRVATGGRVSFDQAVKAQLARFEDDKRRMIAIAEPLLQVCENIVGMDEEELAILCGVEDPSEITTDAIFNELDPLVRLGILNALWKKLGRLIELDYPAKKVPTRDFAGDFALLAAAELEVLSLTRTIHELCVTEYVAHLDAGRTHYDVVKHLERIQREAAATTAKPMTALVVPARRRLVKKVDAAATLNPGTAMAEAAKEAVTAAEPASTEPQAS